MPIGIDNCSKASTVKVISTSSKEGQTAEKLSIANKPSLSKETCEVLPEQVSRNNSKNKSNGSSSSKSSAK